LSLGHRVAASTIAKVLKSHDIDPAPRPSTWRQFLRRQAAGIAACDFFSADTASLRPLYVLFFIHHGTRRVSLAGTTRDPTGGWATQCARNVSPGLRDAGVAVKYLLGDRDGKSGPGSDAVWEGEGANVVRGPGRAPDADAIAERRVRTVRPERPDRLLIVNEAHLRRVLDRYVRHYNENPRHRSLALHSPQPRAPAAPPEPATVPRILRQEGLGGLINEYHAA
jgi:putative transposase